MASDVSEYGIGAMILHIFEDGSTQPLTHASRTLFVIEKITTR